MIFSLFPTLSLSTPAKALDECHIVVIFVRSTSTLEWKMKILFWPSEISRANSSVRELNELRMKIFLHFLIHSEKSLQKYSSHDYQKMLHFILSVVCSENVCVRNKIRFVIWKTKIQLKNFSTLFFLASLRFWRRKEAFVITNYWWKAFHHILLTYKALMI